MPINYVINSNERLVVTKASGIVTFQEIKLHQERLIADPNLDRSFNQLIDATAITEFNILPQEAARIASVSVFSTTSRRAFVASNPMIYGMGRLMEAYHEMTSSHSLVRVFYNISDALTWIAGPEVHIPTTGSLSA